jgi:steroid delta-isomerase-like uncharacterized protein
MKTLLKILPLVFLFCLICSCQDKKAKANFKKFKIHSEVEQQNAKLVRRWLEEVDQDNFEQLYSELWAKDCKQYMNSGSEPIDYDQFEQMIKNLYSEFPVITHEIHDIIAQGDKVIVRFTARTIHDVDSFGMPATGKELKWRAIAIFQISDGKLQTRWEVADMLSMYEQLGIQLQMQASKK